MKNNKNKISKQIKKHLITKIPVVNEKDSLKKVFFVLEDKRIIYDSVDFIYVVNDTGNLIGYFSVKAVFNNSKDKIVKDIMKKSLITVSPMCELEKVAHLALKHDLKQVPVVKKNKLLGVVSSRVIFSTINKALKEDIFNFAGIHDSHLEFENSLKIPFLKIIKGRLPWLVIGFFGAMFMASYIALFEETLAKFLIISFFVPAIVYISGSVATQVQTIFVRDLAFLGKNINLKKYFFIQLGVAFLISLVISFLMFLFISLFWKNPFIAFVVSLACFISIVLTSMLAFFITLLIKKFNFDPALGSGPIATILSDILSVIVYFIVVIWLI
jgi:magnesium transporter